MFNLLFHLPSASIETFSQVGIQGASEHVALVIPSTAGLHLTLFRQSESKKPAKMSHMLFRRRSVSIDTFFSSKVGIQGACEHCSLVIPLAIGPH